MQTYHVINYSNVPGIVDQYNFEGVPDPAWILTLVAGGLNILYVFVGYWLSERRRLVWRAWTHRTFHPLHCINSSAIAGVPHATVCCGPGLFGHHAATAPG
jgi:hypothetical protein